LGRDGHKAGISATDGVVLGKKDNQFQQSLLDNRVEQLHIAVLKLLHLKPSFLHDVGSRCSTPMAIFSVRIDSQLV
jgi:hypothetical protein